MAEAAEEQDDVEEIQAEGEAPDAEDSAETENRTSVSIEDLAKEWGWNPNKDEWKGDGEWRDAEQFIRLEREIRGKSQDTIKRMHGELKDLKNTVQTMAAGESKRLLKALDDQKRRLIAERKQAVAEGDSDKFDEIDASIKSIEEQHKEIKEQPKVDPRQQEFVDGEKDFLSKNEWYGKNRLMTAEALFVAKSLREVDPNITAEEFYADIERAVKKKFPEEFTNPNRSKASAVSADRPSSRAKSSNWGEMVKQYPEAETVFKSWVEKGVYKDTPADKERYAKSVLEDE